MTNVPKQPEILKSRLNEVFDDPDELADRIAEIFACPITIENSYHHVISYSKHNKNIDEARISTIMNRKVPNKVINGLWKQGIMPQLLDSDDPVVIPEIKEIGLGNRVAVTVRNKNEILGFIWAHTAEKTLSDDELELLKKVTIYLKDFFLKQSQRKRKSEEGYQDFFWQLLTDTQTTADISRQAKRFNMKLEGILAIVVIRFSDDITEQIEKHAHYLSETQVKVQVIYRLFDDNDFIMLVRLIDNDNPKNQLNEFIEQFIEKIRKQLRLKNITGSSGLAYEEPQYIKDSYKQAVRVLQLKSKFPSQLSTIHRYEDLGVYQFIEELYEIRKTNQYQNKHIEKLRSYDKKHRTALLKTLHVYLQCDCNVYQAAKKMFIHSNTMNYRLKRIREEAEINLKDPNQKMTIHLDLIMESLKEG
ncbi:PucR family transcriptional regulator [Oceanobacillus saliphilus]|uniref:PucR family transcriptional regulator n=1 Tax=Oceanobacillus saliphilus TaxID=2925834 RepID=UPI00201E5B91|nr:helix-turn-helix domain-containing protein [Oceanobacillus saliphilus]